MNKIKIKMNLVAFIIVFLILFSACSRNTLLSYDEVMKLPVAHTEEDSAQYSFRELMDLICREHALPSAFVRLVPEEPARYVVVSSDEETGEKEITGETVTPIRILEVYECMNGAPLSGGSSYEVQEGYYLLPATKKTADGTSYGSYERFFDYYDQDFSMDEEKDICIFPEDGEYPLPPASYLSDYKRWGHGVPLEPGRAYYAMVCFIEGNLEIVCIVPTAGAEGATDAVSSYRESVERDLYDYIKEKASNASAE